MKKSCKIIILSGLILCSFLSAFAQERKVTEQELTTFTDNAYKKLKDKTYRVTMTSESYVSVKDSSPNQLVNAITEYISPDRRHSIYERKVGETMFREETISIGQKEYVKQNNEDWKEISAAGNGSGSGFRGSVINNEKNVVSKYKGNETIKNQKADLYEIVTTRKYSSPNFNSTTVITEKFWLNKDGLFLKRESDTKIDNKKNISHIVWEYEYDLNIKIEDPIIKAKAKQNPK